MHDRGKPEPGTTCPTCGRPGYCPSTHFDADDLVAAIRLLVGDKVFSVHDLMTFALMTEGPLRRAIGGLSAKQLGKKLRALRGKCFGDFVLERLDRDNLGAIWQLQHRRSV
jgi:hypothetical protein